MSRRQHVIIKICAAISLCILVWNAMQYRSRADISFTPAKFNQMVTINHQNEYIDHVIQLQRREILQEMENFEYPSGRFGIDAEKLADLTPETSGKPIRSIIITTWRSGSSFLGDMLNAMPGNYYHFEPLMPIRVSQIRGPPSDKKAIRNIRKLLNCDYSDMDEYLKFRDAPFFLSYNVRLWKHCKEHRQYCENPEFVSPFCKLFPLQSLKVVRLRLALAEQLLDDTSLNVRILLLVRDPRGTMQSRNHASWCRRDRNCYDASYLCNDLVSDYYAAELLYKKYPSRFRAIRYEDFSNSPYNMSQDVLQFYGLPFHNTVKEFLDIHTKVNQPGELSTFRDANFTPIHWIRDLKWYQIEEIEKSCTKAMNVWGYRQMNNSTQHLPGFDPILPAPFRLLFI